MTDDANANGPAVMPATLAPVLKVLGHADRLRIVDVLTRRSASVGDLAETLELAPNAVSQHLNMMLARGILSRRREGRRVYYDVVHPAALTLMRCIRDNAPEGNANDAG